MARTSFVDVALRLRGANRFNAEVGAATKKLEAMGLKGAGAMGAFAKKASAFQSAGRTLTTRLTLPIALAGAAAIKMSTDYDSAFGKIERLVGINAKQLDAWKESVLGISRETAVAPKDLADALFFVTSAGLRGKTALDALNASARASAIGLGDTETVADAVTSAMNAYGPSVLSATQATDVLVAAVREGKMEAGELAPVIGRVIPIAEAMGVSFDQAAGAMAVMSRSGTNAATAAVQTSAILTTFAKPTTQMASALDQMGLSVEGVRKQLANKGLVPTIANLRTEAEKAGVDLAQVFGNKRALTGVLQLTKNAKETDRIMSKLADSAGMTDEAFAKLQTKNKFKLTQALNEIRIVLIEVGAALAPIVLPVLTKALRAIGDAFKALKKQPKEVKILFAALIGIAALLGPALLLVAFAMKAVGVAMIIVTSPISLIVIGIIALIALLIAAYVKFDWFRKGVNFVLKAIVAYFRLAFNVWKTVITTAIKVIGAVLKSLVAAFGVAKDRISGALNWIKGAATNTKNWIVNAFNNVVSFFKGLPGKISSAVRGAFDGIKDAFRSAINFIIRGWNGLDLSLSIAGKTVSIGTPNIPELAMGGTVTAPGTALVGERGPELLSLPQGASVIPLSPALKAGGSQRIEVPVYLNGRQIALAVAGEVADAKARS
jgi:TP901 family phage tail tape measure protein